MKEKILETIKELEKKHNVKIVWAIESGSRAWGFASKDSDYDVRCMHIGKIDDYLNLDIVPKQINFSDGLLDIESWDIRKFTELSINSNPQIAEWLRSPIVYIDSDLKKKYRGYFDNGCSLEFLKQHYVRMAKQNYHKYMGIGIMHSCKKYLYVLRALACAEYIEKKEKLPPLPYKDVISYLPKHVSDFFEKCVIVKNTTEKAEINSNEDVLNFIQKMLSIDLKKKERKFSCEVGLRKYMIECIKKQKFK